MSARDRMRLAQMALQVPMVAPVALPPVLPTVAPNPIDIDGHMTWLASLPGGAVGRYGHAALRLLAPWQLRPSLPEASTEYAAVVRQLEAYRAGGAA